MFYVAPISNHTSTALRDTPFLQLASFEEIFRQGMQLKIQIQNPTAKQSFCMILMVDIHNYI